MTTLSHPIAPLPKNANREPVATGVAGSFVHRLRRSRSLASMLPSLLLSGVITFVMTAVMHLSWSGWSNGFFGAWMESWLTAWPIAFPVAYLMGPVLNKIAACISAPAARAEMRPQSGLAFGDIANVSDTVTANNGFVVLRNLKPAHDFSAV
ncbi:MAG TPA: DUF2798 domain-containing protein [Noviherbaspirillum sp.]|nr:DUF2798 domain-containing protein [Noviherbaspirillum sp.]